MNKRLISFLLAVMLLLGLMPPGVLAKEIQLPEENVYTRNLVIFWGENGENQWGTWYDPATGITDSSPMEDLPEGVTWENHVLTLNGANLYRVELLCFGDTPVTLRILGQNTIRAADTEALWAYGSFDLTIEGEGILNLQSNKTPLFISGTYPHSDFLCPDSQFTIRDVTIHAVNTYDDSDFSLDTAWECNAVCLDTNTTIDGAKLYLRGHRGLDTSGNLIIDGGAEIDADGFYTSGRIKHHTDNSYGYYPAQAVIGDATLRIQPHRNKCEHDFFVFDICPGAVLTVKDGADIQVDCSGTDRNWHGVIAHDDYTEFMKPGELYMEGGRIEVWSEKVEGSSAFHIATGSEYHQSGGEVIVHALSKDTGVSMWDDALCEITGGSMTVYSPGNAISIGNRNVWNQFGGDIAIEMESDGEACGIWIGWDSVWNQTDGTVTVSNRSEAMKKEFDPENGFVHAVQCHQGSEWIMTGGELCTEGQISGVMNIQGNALVAGGTIMGDVLYVGFELFQGGTMTVAEGTIDVDSKNWTMEIAGSSGLSVLGGRLDLTGPVGLWLSNSSARFLGGETTIHASEMAIKCINSSCTFAEGIHAAYDDGMEAAFEGEWDGAIYAEGRPVLICRQGVAGANTSIIMDMTANGPVTAGVPTGVRIVPLLTEPTGILEVELPEGASLAVDSVYAAGEKRSYTLTERGFTTQVNSGDLLSFTIQPMTAGAQTIAARAEGLTQTLEFECSQYRLTLPTMVADPVIRTSGTALPGGTLTFYEEDTVIGQAKISAVGTWSAQLTLPDAEGWHNVHAILQGPGGEYRMITDFTQVLYDPDAVEIKTLTISNWIHGNSLADPNKLTKTVIDYQNGTTDPGYYIYWPDLPEFTFEAEFDQGGTPEKIYNVRIIATDRRGREQEVPLTYDSQSGTWKGKQDFCAGGTITPESFRVTWSVYEWWEAPQAPVWEPDQAPEDTETDSTTGGVLILPGDSRMCTVRISGDAAVAQLLDGPGNTVSYTVSDGELTFPVLPGEVYALRLASGSFPDYPGETELNILVEDDALRGEFVYQDNVYLVDSEDLTDLTDTGFCSDAGYRIGDVLVIDSLQAVTITECSGERYRYTAAALDQIYARLDVSGIDTTQPLKVEWDTEEETLVRQFLDSGTFAQYLDTLEYTVNAFEGEKKIGIEIGDTSVDISVTYGYADNGDVYVKPVFTAETKMKTKLPVLGEQETSVKAQFYYEIRENIDYRLRSDNQNTGVQIYYLYTDETITDGVSITVSIGDDGEPNRALYFSDKLQTELYENYLEKLEGGEEDTLHLLKDLKIYIPTPASPAVNIYIKPAVDLEWNFFGEVSITAEKIQRSTYGIIAVHLGDSALMGWDVRTFCQQQEPEQTLETKLHLKASVGLMFKGIVGVSVVDCLDLGLYAEIGPVLAASGHGTVAWSNRSGGSANTELLETFSIDAAIGAVVHIHLSKFPLGLKPLEYELAKTSATLMELGARTMPWKFTVRETSPVVVPWKADLKNYIKLQMECQNFNFNDTIFSNSKVMALDDYTFELAGAAPVTLTEDGLLTVLDTKNEFYFDVKVTYHGSGEDYKIWKIVPMKYAPSTLTIRKSAECPPPVAGFKILNLTNPQEAPISTATNESGVVTVELTTGCTYLVKETSAPPCNVPVEPTEKTVYANGHVSAGFSNVCNKGTDPVGPDILVPPIADPSGFVFEGIESNRLSGVTVTLYQADDAHGTNTRIWNAAPFDQNNPLTTDEMGQYLWMVPDGWWQVRYELAGYESAESEWMVVPPIRTEVNQALVSSAPAEAELRYSQELGCLVLTFDRPVIVNSLHDCHAAVDGTETNVWLEALDADWSVTENLTDSRMCATAFRVWFPENTAIADTTVTLELGGSMTYHFVASDGFKLRAQVPRQKLYYLHVDGGTGMGYYNAGDTVTVTAYDGGCYAFEGWYAEGVELPDPDSSTIRFTMPEQNVYLSAVYAREPVHDWKGLTCIRCGEKRSNPFVDVKAGAFYYKSVLWAVEHEITAGMTASTFAPDNQCTRGQVVTFLWRAAEKPEPISTGHPFTDVKEGAYYYKAMLWAVENGITSGMDATHFAPNAFCTRAQVVTFLYRAKGKPAVSSAAHPFTDVSEKGFYYQPMLWAVENGITSGMTATSFAPDRICTRGQVVTFLYRAFGA